jgi:hypothetical protein
VRQVADEEDREREPQGEQRGLARLRIRPVNSGTMISMTQPPPLRPPVTTAIPVM